MASYDKLIGKRFDKLVVIEYIPGVNGKRAMRRCKCDCGNECLKDDKYLNICIRRSCGCHLNMKTKICASCKIEKPKSEFHPCSDRKIGVQSKCKECQSSYKKTRYWNNREAELEKMTASRLKPENVKQRKGYYKKNKADYRRRYKEIIADESKKISRDNANKSYQKSERGKALAKNRYLRRMENDMCFILKNRLRTRIRHVVVDLARGVNIKRFKTMDYLGCSPEFFKDYLESKFTDGMCWERISEIHVDHIRPCSTFDLTDTAQQLECFNWKNLQPLWALDNIIKSNKYNIPY